MVSQRPIVVDTREKEPFQFKGYRVKRSGLTTGDYSVEGFEGRVAVERKSGSDLVNTVLVNRDRFARELERASEMEAFVVVVECSMASLLLGTGPRTSVPLRTILARLAVLSSKSKASVIFCDNRSVAEQFTLEVLRPYFAKI